MVILRPTRKLHSTLRPSTGGQHRSDTALGDWYVNRVVVDRQPLLLLVSSASLLPILVPARDVRALPDRLASVVTTRLRRLALAREVIDAEAGAMATVAIGPAVDRSVLGIMADFARGLPFYLEPGRWDETSLARVEDLLAETPCHATRKFEHVVFPERKCPELLYQRWLAHMPLPPANGPGIH